jgi:hypothetical protein
MGDSQSQFAPDSTSQHGELEVDEGQVEDASVRALRPRSSRRGSWESEASGWSARVAMVRERSLKASSWKTGAQTDAESTEITGEEMDESKGMHGPSPLAANGFTTADAIVPPAEEEATTPPAKELQEIKFVEASANAKPEGKGVVCTAQSQAAEVERTPTKRPLAKTDDDSEEDLTQKKPVKEKDVPLAGTRTSGDAVEVAQ